MIRYRTDPELPDSCRIAINANSSCAGLYRPVLAGYGNQYQQDAPAALKSYAGGASCRYWLFAALLASLELPLNSSLADTS